MNVDDYLARISYTGPREPNLANLQAIITAHKTSLPFSNLRLHGCGEDRKIQLDLRKMYDHVITNGSSGICYELIFPWIWLLRQLGYDVFGVRSAVQFEEGLSRPDLHMTPMVRLDGELYYADPSLFVFGAIKVKHMAVKVTPFDVYRFREIPSDRESPKKLVFERHSKTVLDGDGRVLKAGPCATGYENCRNDLECQKEDSAHWVTKLVTSDMTSRRMEEFAPVLESILSDRNSELRKKIYVCGYGSGLFSHTIYGELYQKKVPVDPIIDQIVCSKELKSNSDVENVVNEVFKFNITHPVNYYKFDE